MVTVDDVEQLASALPEVTEGTSWGNRCWFVRTAFFCWVRPFSKADVARFGDAPVPSGPVVGLRTEDVGEAQALLAEGVAGFFTIPHLAGFPGYLVQLDVVDAGRFATAVEDAWLARAPKRLAATYLDQQEPRCRRR